VSSGRVVALHVKPQAGTQVAVEEVLAVEGKGLEGHKDFGRRHRQVLFLATETLADFGYAPGDLREQILVELPGLQQLPAGSKLQVGEAVFFIEADCEPCSGMAARLGEDATEFKSKTAGRRGMLAGVTRSGRVRVGDAVAVLS